MSQSEEHVEEQAAAAAPVETLSFRQAMEELEGILERIEGEEVLAERVLLRDVVDAVELLGHHARQVPAVLAANGVVARCPQ